MTKCRRCLQLAPVLQHYLIKKTMQEIHLGNREQIHLRKALSNPFRIFFASIKQHHIAYHHSPTKAT